MIETLFNEKIYLIGYSIGAFFALKLAMACENKFTGLSLVSPFLFIDVKVHKKSNLPKIFKSRFMKFLFNIFFIHIYRMFLIARLKKSFYPEKIPKEKQEDALKKYGNLEYLLSTIVDINFFIKNTLNEEEFKKIKLKVLSICCKDDKICDSIAFSNKVKEYKNDLEISIIENGGHGLIFTHPEEMFGLISNHITRISTD
ncbi:MAG: hypothetical protein A2086_10515 [Spirochaetes bacterium GWD1_27_9]|nr:MAG: hypothetical protein A2086_10515 [Spirochaetes bacterium GWD1_27_9]